MNKSRIQYFHSHRKSLGQEHTVALNVPMKETLHDFVKLKMTHPNAQISINMGITYLHEKDFYSYHTGRIMSEKNITHYMFDLVTVNFTKDSTIFKLKSNNYCIYLETKETRIKPHFIHFHTYQE